MSDLFQLKKNSDHYYQIPVYLCGGCNCDIVFFTENFEENSIECENCNRWYHYFKCVHIIEDSDIPQDIESWLCPDFRISFVVAW